LNYATQHILSKFLLIELNVLLSKLTWPEIKEYLKKDNIILFPTGSTEQHGKHLVVDTDTFAAYEIAQRVIKKQVF